MKHLLFVLLTCTLTLFSMSTYAQFESVLYTDGVDELKAISLQTSSGNVIVAGSSDDISGSNEMVVMSINTSTGQPVWSRWYGDNSTDNDVAYNVLTDGNTIWVGGFKDHTNQDNVLVKLGATGLHVADYFYGGNNDEYYRSTLMDVSGNLVSTGYHRVNNNDVELVIFDPSTNTYTAKHYASSNVEYGFDLKETNNGYVICGYQTNSSIDALILNVTTSGTINWAMSYDVNSGASTPRDGFNHIEIASNGDYILTGFTRGADVSGNGTADNDILVMRVSSNNGAIIWARAYGGDEFDTGRDLIIRPSGNIIVGAETESFGHGGRDIALLEISPTDGRLLNSVLYGGSGDDAIGAFDDAMLLLDDGHLMFAGNIYSTDTDDDFYVVHVDSNLRAYCNELLDTLESDTITAIDSTNRFFTVTDFGKKITDSHTTDTLTLGDSLICEAYSGKWAPSYIVSGTLDEAPIGLHVYPNPSNGILNVKVELNGYSGWGTIRIIDTYGRVMSETTEILETNNYVMNIESLPAGLYYLTIETPEGVGKLTRSFTKM